ncbi:exodeoxyribonuclease VII large subunit [Limnobacter humi]|uniref:Exodeoxyribonuclease 7 large subunit n=1 Tax=Limnobacter humi TaxID=1778671 RepID=A0ABT1WG92_9BURK|nr:exodeoxyribonuclease VII large subunit [Limnobacter humi]MCQ8896533.1 exodeoxyribonuclease VII large subunit [Limnobacter humi]
MIDNKTLFSVSQFTRLLNDTFREQFRAVRLQGELSSFTRASSGHWYFTLKDEQAQLKAVMFRPRNVLTGFTPQLGDKVEVLAQLALYEQRGEVQLVVDVLKKAGLGNLYEQFLQLKAKLAAEGLFDRERKKALPAQVFDVGIVTSLQAAALADVRQALARRSPHVRYTVYHTPVQGDAAAAQIVQALQKADAGAHAALILCRGGGSLEDLWSFNTEAVVRAVAACRTPIVVGVGHETDITLAEFAADIRAATPTAAAELVSRPTKDLLNDLDALWATLHGAVARCLEQATQRIDHAELGLVTPSAHVDLLATRLGALQTRLRPLLDDTLKRHAAVIDRHADLGQRLMRQGLRQVSDQLNRHGVALTRASSLCVTGLETRLAQHSGLLEAVSPQRTLERGYAYLERPDQAQVVSSIRNVSRGDSLVARLSDGRLDLSVQTVHPLNDTAIKP